MWVSAKPIIVLSMAMALSSIKISGDKIEIVNQLLLPHVTEFLEIRTIEEAHDAIKTMKVGFIYSISHPVSETYRCRSVEHLP